MSVLIDGKLNQSTDKKKREPLGLNTTPNNKPNIRTGGGGLNSVKVTFPQEAVEAMNLSY